MPTPALYDTLSSFKDIHKVILNLAADLNDEQLNWKPEDYSTSIGFHLWHLGRESDYLKAAILHHNPQFVPEFGDGKEIWEKEGLARKWGFSDGLHETVGTGLSDEAAANFPIPKKDELLDYLRNAYEAIEQFIELLDTCYPNFEDIDEELNGNDGMFERFADRLWFGNREDEINVISSECWSSSLKGVSRPSEQSNSLIKLGIASSGKAPFSQ